jgi:transcription elongation factor GreB
MTSSNHLITREGRSKLENELDYLWRTERRAVTQSVTEAAAHGDRSENAEFIKEPLFIYYTINN